MIGLLAVLVALLAVNLLVMIAAAGALEDAVDWALRGLGDVLEAVQGVLPG